VAVSLHATGGFVWPSMRPEQTAQTTRVTHAILPGNGTRRPYARPSGWPGLTPSCVLTPMQSLFLRGSRARHGLDTGKGNYTPHAGFYPVRRVTVSHGHRDQILLHISVAKGKIDSCVWIRGSDAVIVPEQLENHFQVRNEEVAFHFACVGRRVMPIGSQPEPGSQNDLFVVV
jgi:hypothetical protein